MFRFGNIPRIAYQKQQSEVGNKRYLSDMVDLCLIRNRLESLHRFRASLPLKFLAIIIPHLRMDHLTKQLALEMGTKCKMRVNSVNPTVVMTDLGKSAWSDPKKAATVLDKIPLARFAEVDEVVRPVLFLLSNDSSMINGCSIPIDGGFVNCN